MKKIRKIVALALATVMMMAMSITAFAEEYASIERGTTTVTINNFPAGSKGATVKAYKIASINEKNEVVVEDWAANAGYLKIADVNNEINDDFEMSSKLASNLEKAFVSTLDVYKTAIVDESLTATFQNVEPGAYFFTVDATEDYAFNAMVAVTYTRDDNGNYVAKSSPVTITAKSEPSKVTKVEDDKYISTKDGDVITYTVTTTIPYVNSNETVTDKFVFVDTISGGKYVTGSDNNLTVSMKYGTESETRSVAVVENEDGSYTFKLPLNDLVENHANELLTLTYQGVATEVTVSNEAYTITPKHNSEETFNKEKIYAYTGKLIVSKVDENDEPLADAKFYILRKTANGTYEYAQLEEGTNKLIGWTSDEKQASTIVTVIENGQATASAFGFDITDDNENKITYYFQEATAPEGWTINSEIIEASWNDTEVSTDQHASAEAHIASATVKDNALVKLPFTGGMGTTIFTVLGVAIMAMAAALYFATKKKATK